MSKKEISKRYALFIISLFFTAFGVAITKHGELGVSPISSVPNVMSGYMDSLSLGTWLIIWNCALIVGQILILKKEFQMIQLLQLPLSFLFGIFTDFGLWCMSYVPNQYYAVRMLLVLGGIIMLGFGVALSVIANVIMNSGEAFVKAISDKSGMIFGNVKIGFDVGCVVLALIISWFLFNGEIVGTREGTVLTALLTGVVVNFFVKQISEPVNRVLSN